MAKDEEVPQEFATLSENELEESDAQPVFASGAQRQMEREMREYTDRSPQLSGGDIDAAWQDADVGEETVGGANPTPDQDIVEELGEAYGVTYQDNEPLDVLGKVEKRDDDRWELNPSSKERSEGD